MGWYYCHRPDTMTIRAFFEREFNHSDPSKGEVLDVAVVKLRTAYIAYRTPTGTHAIVCLLGYAPKDHHNFGYKAIDEEMGPIECECPARIFNQLSPLPDDGEKVTGYARNWRAKVQARLDARKTRPKLHDGMQVKFAQPLDYGSWGKEDTFTVHVRNGKVSFQIGYMTYNVPRWAERPYEVLTT